MKWLAAVAVAAMMACAEPSSAPPADSKKPADAQHAGITTPHDDHSPHHGGMVLMNGELHYEVVLDPGGQHRLWFSNAVREDLPASVASQVKLIVTSSGGVAGVSHAGARRQRRELDRGREAGRRQGRDGADHLRRPRRAVRN